VSAFAGLLPTPVTVTETPGEFALTERTTLTGPAWLGAALRAATGLPLPPGDAITFELDPELPAEGYRLEITEARVRVRGADHRGLSWAGQTLRQLLGPDAQRVAPVRRGWALPCGVVTDRPDLRWRGVLLDVARHFVTKPEVLRFVDQAAAHKLNVLHLHLTDDQGWRLEVPAFPRLTEMGGWRTESSHGHPVNGGRPDGRPHGGWYTTADLREIVGYAAERGITVVPEVDTPGHVQAALAAYPELGATGRPLPVWTSWGVSEHVLDPSESTVDFFRQVFDHVVEVFDSPVIGVGGDEVPTVEWAGNPRIAELNLAGPRDLIGWFVGRMATHLAEHGRRALGWDEITESSTLPPNTIVASWRGVEAGLRAARAGHDVLLCPEQRVYLDHRQSADPTEPIPVGFVSTVEDVYRHRHVPADLPADAAGHILGAQANVWTEQLDSARRIDYATHPRLAAFAETAWSRPDARDLPGFLTRLREHHLPRLAAAGVEYRPLTGPLPHQRMPGVPGKPR
jgi:hexosaminidase